MSRTLTTNQTEDLHKSMLAYLLSMNAIHSSTALREELKVGDISDAAARQRYLGQLERRWTNFARVQRRIMDLEAENKNLRAKVHAALTSRPKQAQDPFKWLPGWSATHTLESHREGITCIAFHPVHTVLASGSEDCTIKIWDWEHGQMERTLKGHTRGVSGVDFGGKDAVLASCSGDLTIKIWDPRVDYANTRTLFGHDHSVSVVRFLTTTGNILVSASRDSSVRFWDVSTGYCLKTLHTGYWVLDLAPTFDGRWLVSAGRNQAATIWEVSSGRTITELLGHDNHIECCAFAPPASHPHLATLAGMKRAEGEFIATGSRDKAIKLWNSRGRLIKTLIGHDNWVRDLVFHPGGRYLISVGDDKTIRCWDLSQEARLVRTIDDVHRHFASCVRWAHNPRSEISKGSLDPRWAASRGENTDNPSFSCVIATGSADSCVRIFR